MYQGDGIDEGTDDENVKTSTLVFLFLSCLSCLSLYIYTRPPNPEPLKVSFSFLLR